MAKNKRPGKAVKPASPAVVRQRSREQLRLGVGAGYLDKRDQFDEAVADFATAYARQNERDYEALARAARQGCIEVYTES